MFPITGINRSQPPSPAQHNGPLHLLPSISRNLCLYLSPHHPVPPPSSSIPGVPSSFREKERHRFSLPALSPSPRTFPCTTGPRFALKQVFGEEEVVGGGGLVNGWVGGWLFRFVLKLRRMLREIQGNLNALFCKSPLTALLAGELCSTAQ